ncbi:hypothetical protein QUW08_15300, partial [Fournierella massiliensis]|nr:hypothetical protein [Fournierella massiliensis]
MIEAESGYFVISERRIFVFVLQKQTIFCELLLSPSTRRAWIEIIWDDKKMQWIEVALHTEGVDRNFAWLEEMLGHP